MTRPMVEMRIHGRGGQGGVTLAKIIATLNSLEGKSVQAFGLYAAERSGAPVQAFVRIDNQTITTRNLIYAPDHIIVLDPTLIGPDVTAGLKPGGWVVLNTSKPIDEFRSVFDGYRIAAVNATRIARENGLGTTSVPIVNTTLAGTVAAIFGHEFEQVERVFENLRFSSANLVAAKTAYADYETLEPLSSPTRGDATAEGTAEAPVLGPAAGLVPGLVDGNTGALPAIRTGQWANQQPKHQRFTPPCNHVCPAGNDVQGFIAHMAKDRIDEALAILHRTSPLPGVCGRVCPAPCIEACNRSALDEPVDVRALERYAADQGRATIEKAAARQEAVTIIGSGPAGLAAAYHLAKLGYQVELYEAGDELGGLLRTGIPAFRLPRDILDREIQQILDLGVRPHRRQRIGRSELLEMTRKTDALFVATGLQEMHSLDLGTMDGEAIMQGITFLERANAGQVELSGRRIVVVGGGNTAFDAARSSLRLGARSVSIVYRRSREEMPAIAEEIDEAIEEGVEVHYLVLPLRLDKVDGRRQLVCARTELGLPDESGRRRPVMIDGSEFRIDCDQVILALGQTAELSLFPEGSTIEEGQVSMGLTGCPVFIGGDLQTNEGTVAAAIGNGRRAAWHIHEVLSGESLFPRNAAEGVIGAEQLTMHLFEQSPAHHGSLMPIEQRRDSFEEVRSGLVNATEALRCLSCGVCNECDRCWTFCPEGVVRKIDGGYEFDYEYCKGCGVCAAECPRNVIVMAEL